MTDASSKPILIVEDLKTDAKLIERTLKRAENVNPLAFVTDGEQAIDYLSAAGEYSDKEKYPQPALVLLDLKLPKRDGFEVLGWMRQQDELKELPVVILSSSSRSPDINRAYDLGANSYLVKPVAVDTIVETLAALNI